VTTTDQPTLDQARAELADALGNVERGAGDEWNAYAYGFVLDYLRSHAELVSDDLWRAGLMPPREPRALGPVLLRAARAGLMHRTAGYRPSRRAHLRPCVVWRSAINEGGT
jgi:hypothetical protein